MISKQDKEHIEAARKYKLRLLTMKLEAFILFDKGYSPAEVRYLLSNLVDPDHPKSFGRTIYRYHLLWKQAQAKKASGK